MHLRWWVDSCCQAERQEYRIIEVQNLVWKLGEKESWFRRWNLTWNWKIDYPSIKLGYSYVDQAESEKRKVLAVTWTLCIGQRVEKEWLTRTSIDADEKA